MGQLHAVRPYEIRETVRLYLAGKIEHWFYKTEGPKGVVFILNVADRQEARDLLKALPLGIAGFMEFELIPTRTAEALGSPALGVQSGYEVCARFGLVALKRPRQHRPGHVPDQANPQLHA